MILTLNCKNLQCTVQLRLKSVQNIRKITKSMKMIASTKVAKAQRAMENARTYGNANNGRSLEGFHDINYPSHYYLFVVVTSILCTRTIYSSEQTSTHGNSLY